MERIGVRELRQNASKVLARVEEGEVIEVTNHGRVVAHLIPAPARPMSRADMIARGELIPGRGNILDIKPVKAPPGTPSNQELLDEQREERL